MDLRQIKNLMKEFEDSTIHKLEINDKDFSVKLEKEMKTYVTAETAAVQTQIAAVAAAPQETIKEEVNNNVLVKAPLVGTYYNAPSPDSEPFCKVGQSINKGDVLFIVEAMKVMNEITAPVSGTIAKLHVSDTTMVEFGQVVVEITE